jgi:hypothetical protein
MQSKELIVGNVNISEGDFFTESKEKIKGDVWAFMVAQGAREFPKEPNTKLKKGVREEETFLHNHLLSTLTTMPELDQEKVDDHQFSISEDLTMIAMEAKKRKDLPENFVDRVAAHILLELASVEAIQRYDLQTLSETVGLPEPEAKTLQELSQAEKAVSYAEWSGKYKGAVAALMEESGKQEGVYEDGALKMAVNSIELLATKVSKRARKEMLTLRDELVLDTVKKVGSAAIVECLIPEEKGVKRDRIGKLESYLALLLSSNKLFEGVENKKLLEDMVTSQVRELGMVEGGLYSTVLLSGWREGWVAGDKQFLPKKEHFHIAQVGEPNGHTYLFDLMDVVDKSVFNEIGSDLLEAHEKTSLTTLLGAHKRKGSVIAKWPVSALSRVADCFVETGYVKKMSGGKYKVKKRNGSSIPSLGYDSLQSIRLAHKYLFFGDKAKPKLETLGDVERIYDRANEEIKVPEIVLGVDNTKTLYLTKVEFGHKDVDLKFIGQVIEQVRDLPESERPSVVVLSDLVQGSFHFTDKRKRLALAGEMASADAQFKASKMLVDQFRAMGIEVVVLQGDDAQLMSEDYTVEALRMLQNMASPLRDRDKSFVTYWQIDQLKQTEAWDRHSKFQWEVVYPYCIRSGRRLRSADEVEAMTNGAIRMEEYLMLMDAYERENNGEELPSEYLKVLELENIPFKDREFEGLHIVDDVNLVLSPNDGSKDFTQRIFNRLGFGRTPLYGDPMTSLVQVSGSMAAEGETLPDLMVLTSQDQIVGKSADQGTWLASTASPHRTDLNQKGSVLRTTGDSSWRQVTNRRVLARPATTSYENTADGHHKVEIMTPTLLEKSVETEPTAIVLLQDWQIGSHSAHVDLPPKLLDYIVTEIAPNYKVLIGANGDLIQGVNYPGAALDNGPMLGSVDSQSRFTSELIKSSLAHFSYGQLDPILEWMLTRGNHEWNSGKKFFGATHTKYVEDALTEILRSRVAPSEVENELRKRVKDYTTMETRDGDFVTNAWTAIRPVGAYGLVMQHLFVDKMAKGQGGLPVYQFKTAIQGIGDLHDQTDLMLTGHWHNGQYVVYGEKVAGIGPSLAGQSIYEWNLGYRPRMGALIAYLGGGGKPAPLTLDFMSVEALRNHKIKDGAFSDQALADEGYTTDPGFDPKRNGFANRIGLHSAMQKKLWRMVDEVNFSTSSRT